MSSVGTDLPTSSHPPDHLLQVDFVRAATILGVIAVHVTFFTNPPNSIEAGGVIMLLHYTREVFLFLTGLVLFYRYGNHRVHWPRFWKTRFRLVAGPYVLWSLIYAYESSYPTFKDIPQFLGLVGIDLLEGRAWYHLYYLLITMQVYLLFPALRAAVTHSKRYHRWLLAASVALELGLMAWYQHRLPTRGLWATLTSYRSLWFATYQLYLGAGCLAAAHLAELNAWAIAHRRLITALWAGSSAFTMLAYGVSRFMLHESTLQAASVFQPVMVPYCLATILLLYTRGLIWARKGAIGWSTRVIRGLAKHSFGLYLIHPLILYAVIGQWSTRIAEPWPILRTAGVGIVTLTTSYALVWTLTRTPLSPYCLGQPGVRFFPTTLIRERFDMLRQHFGHFETSSEPEYRE
jgi:peptidoglycan/LPS O-acetylase OafA/YrhL